MPQKQYEIEVKVLLGGKAHVRSLLKKLKTAFPALSHLLQTSQLNHYFLPGSEEQLLGLLSPYLEKKKLHELKKIFEMSQKYSLRTRWEDGRTLFVVKASTHGKDSVHDLRRLEFEEVFPVEIGRLDELILSAGYSYQSKWSRDRSTYAYKDFTVCIDKNAGYGYLAEFEKVIYNESDIEKTRVMILAEIRSLGLEELPNDRLNRMFSHYNMHWREYYQTEKTFTVE